MCLIYDKNYLRKMFYFYLSDVGASRSMNSDFNALVKGYFSCAYSPFPHHCPQVMHYILFWIMFYNRHFSSIYITLRPNLRTRNFVLACDFRTDHLG